MKYTSIEQSKKLVELGLSSETADLLYVRYKDGKKPLNGDADLKHTFQASDGDWYSLDLFEYYFNDGKFETIPCWSVGDLLELMPSVIEKNGKEYVLELLKDIDDEPFYILRYYDLNNIELDIVQREDEDLMLALYQMTVWLLENEYIQKQ